MIHFLLIFSIIDGNKKSPAQWRESTDSVQLTQYLSFPSSHFLPDAPDSTVTPPEAIGVTTFCGSISNISYVPRVQPRRPVSIDDSRTVIAFLRH